MPNPYLADALRKQQEKRKRLQADKSSEGKKSPEKKAAESAGTVPDKES